MVQAYRKREKLGQIDSVGAFMYSSLPIPVLTSNSQHWYIVTATTDLWWGQSGRTAFDGAWNDWHSTNIGSWWIAYIQIQLPTASTATQLFFKARVWDPNNRQPATTITLQWSNNGSTWTQLFTQPWLSWTLWQERTFTITSPWSYLYYKINMTASSTWYVATNQIQLS